MQAQPNEYGDPFLYEDAEDVQPTDQPAVDPEPLPARNLWDLPMWGEFWKADGREVER